VSVAGVAVDADGRVLVIRRRDNGRWEPPGGVLEPDETIENGVVREVREETGVTVAVDGLSGVYQNVPRRIIALVFRCRPVSGIPCETDEARDVQWVEPSRIDDLMLPAYAVRIHDALAGVPVPARLHDGICLISRQPSPPGATHANPA
jgi:8-oxo-dGTP pyrophosphatase MutT (NUDIX family)